MSRGVILLAAGLAAASVVGADSTKEDLKNGQGNWTVVSVEIDGKDASNAFKEAKVTVKGERVTLAFPNGTELVRTFKLDATTKPKCIDIKNDKGETTEGIYELKGDELKVCLSIKGGVAERPDAFTTESGSGRVLYALRRNKP